MISSKTANAIIRSFTNEIEEINQLKTEATTDSLTRLLNRNGLEQAVGTAWAFCQRDKKKVGVILADIDYFKSYNDTLGHTEGDNILKQVADSIKSCFRREIDIISRIGGDEFLIFLPDVNDDRVLEMAQSLSSSIINLKVKTTLVNNTCDFLSVSMGIATRLPQPNDLLIDLYKTVDEALYRAKKAGRNCISFHEKIIQIGASMDESFPVMSPEIIVALVSFVGTAVGSIAGVLTANKLTNYRIEQLEIKVDKYNGLKDRTTIAENEIKRVEQKFDESFKVANHRIKDLEDLGKPMLKER